MNDRFCRRFDGRLCSLLRTPERAACSLPSLFRRNSFLFFALLLLLCAPACFGQAAAPEQQAPAVTSDTVTGMVVDDTGKPIADAQIINGSGDLLATTGADGKFTVPADAGTVAIEASRFAPATVTIARQAPLRSPAGTSLRERHRHRLSLSVNLPGQPGQHTHS